MLEYLEFSSSILQEFRADSNELELVLEGNVHVWEDDAGKAGRATLSLRLSEPTERSECARNLELPSVITSGELWMDKDHESIVSVPYDRQKPCALVLATENATLHFAASALQLRRTSNIWNLENLDPEFSPASED